MSHGAEKGVLVLGDSHAKFFFKFGTRENQLDDSTRIFCRAIGAASITGFGRSRSTLNLNTAVRQLIERVGPHCQHALFAFGQVDVEHGLYYRWVVKREKIEPEAQFSAIIPRYLEMVAQLSGDICPIIKGINQTVLKGDHAEQYAARVILHDEKDAKRLAELRNMLHEQYPDYGQRRAISTLFNRMLAEHTADAGWPYFDINSAIVDKDSNEVHDLYWPNFDDHHIVDSAAVHKLHLEHLEAAIGRSLLDEKTV